MRRLVDRPRTGRWRTRWPDYCRRFAGEGCAGYRKLYRRVSATTSTMNLSRTLAGAICLGMIAFTGPAFAERTNEIAEAARPIDEGVPEAAVYQLQKLTARLNGVDKIRATEKLAEALIAAQRPTEALRLLEDPILRDSTR